MVKGRDGEEAPGLSCVASEEKGNLVHTDLCCVPSILVAGKAAVLRKFCVLRQGSSVPWVVVEGD